MSWKDLVNAIDIAQKEEIPQFCFDPEFVNLAEAYAQFMFSAKCAYIAQDQFISDVWGCLDSGLI